MFSVFCKVFELLLLDHIECIAQEQSYFSDLQFTFSKGVGCIEHLLILRNSRDAKDGLLGKFSIFLIILMFSVCKGLVVSHLSSCKLISESCSSLVVLSAVRDIFKFRAKEYFRNPDCVPTGFMGDIVRPLKKYYLHSYFGL